MKLEERIGWWAKKVCEGRRREGLPKEKRIGTSESKDERKRNQLVRRNST
jgi:hypothetical protein